MFKNIIAFLKIEHFGINMLDRKEFDILVASLDGKNSQRDIAIKSGYSLGTVNKVYNDLEQKGFIKNKVITDAGKKALEPYECKRAIFIAAGFGSRMVPVTLNTPKPLVRVKGKRIIDGLLDMCLSVGINEIYIVRGYLGSQFDQLLEKYPMIKFIENDLYNEANNISSALLAKDLLENAYVFEADLLVCNPNVIKKYHYCSDFMGFKVDKTDDWCFTTKNGIITSQVVGGVNCYQEVGISYWNKEDGKKLKKDIEELFNSPGGKERYWDQAPMLVYKKNYKVEINECQPGDIIEIDTYKELCALDSLYKI